MIQKAEGQPPEPLRPWLGVIGSLANLLLAVSESSGAALGNFLLIDSDGMTPEMVAYAERLHHKEQTFSFHAHSLNAVALDLQNRMAHGHTRWVR